MKIIGSIFALLGALSLVGQFITNRVKPDGDISGQIGGYFLAFLIMLIGVALSSKKKTKKESPEPKEESPSQ